MLGQSSAGPAASRAPAAPISAEPWIALADCRSRKARGERLRRGSPLPGPPAPHGNTRRGEFQRTHCRQATAAHKPLRGNEALGETSPPGHDSDRSRSMSAARSSRARKKIWWMTVVRVPPAPGDLRRGTALSVAWVALAGSAAAGCRHGVAGAPASRPRPGQSTARQGRLRGAGHECPVIAP
jgi:hypothetical protein